MAKNQKPVNYSGKSGNWDRKNAGLDVGDGLCGLERGGSMKESKTPREEGVPSGAGQVRVLWTVQLLSFIS